MDYIYGKLNSKAKVIDYFGVDSDTATTVVDNDGTNKRTIKVEVIKTPKTLTIHNTNLGTSQEFNGSEDVDVELDFPSTTEYNDLVTRIEKLENDTPTPTTYAEENLIPSSDISKNSLKDIRTSMQDTIYPRHITKDIILIKDGTYKVSKNGFSKGFTVVLDTNVTDIEDVQPNFYNGMLIFTYKAKFESNNVIRAFVCNLTDSGAVYRKGTIVTIDSDATHNLSHPFTLIESNTKAYIIYSKENNSNNQDIVYKEITISNNEITAIEDDYVLVGGTNQQSDSGEIIANSKVGFPVVEKLVDNSYLLLFESNINEADGYPSVIQYRHFKDIMEEGTYSPIKTLIKVKGESITAPYISVKSDGRIVITYHSTENFFGTIEGVSDIHSKTFEAILNDTVVTYSTELIRKDFVKLSLYDNKENQWCGNFGSVYTYNEDTIFLYGVGSNDTSTTITLNFYATFITRINVDEVDVLATDNSIIKRTRTGQAYAKTPNASASLTSDNRDLIVTRGYVSDYITPIVDNINTEISNLDSQFDAYVVTKETVLTEEIKEKIVKSGKIMYDVTTVYYVEDTDGGSLGGGLNLFNGDNRLWWDLNTTFSTVKKLPTHVESVTTPDIAYGTNESGSNSSWKLSKTAIENAIPLYNEEGVLKVGEAKVDTDAINKFFADNTYVSKFKSRNVLYRVDDNGNTTSIIYAPTPIASVIPQYTPNETLKTNDPTEDTEATNKKYVDDLHSESSTAIADLENKVNDLENNKFDKNGGVVNGNVTIKGNVNVEGTATATDTQTLQVKDNIIMTNTEGKDLVNLSGIAIRVNATDVYGIVYDLASDSVKLGLGKIVNNQFVFNENEGNPVATRTDSSSLTNGHLMQWNANSHRLEDSGIASSNVGKKNTTPSSLNWTNANGVETSMTFRTSETLTSDNDLNDIRTYGIYQIYANSTPLNTPSNIVQNAILVVLKSNLLSHCCQLYIGTSRYFIRYWTSANWTSWQELAVGTKVPTIRSLNKDDDLNNLTEYAMYQIYYQSDVANLPKNLPSGLNTNSILNVYQVYSGNTAQVINTSNNALYIRYSYNSGETWSAWTKMASESYVTSEVDIPLVNDNTVLTDSLLAEIIAKGRFKTNAFIYAIMDYEQTNVTAIHWESNVTRDVIQWELNTKFGNALTYDFTFATTEDANYVIPKLTKDTVLTNALYEEILNKGAYIITDENDNINMYQVGGGGTFEVICATLWQTDTTDKTSIDWTIGETFEQAEANKYYEVLATTDYVDTAINTAIVTAINANY